MLGRLNGLTLCTIGYARTVFLRNSFDAFAHKMGELATECCRTQNGLRAPVQDGRLLLGPESASKVE
jgi:hypothetical protein